VGTPDPQVGASPVQLIPTALELPPELASR
jgi:hypothetical protein